MLALRSGGFDRSPRGLACPRTRIDRLRLDAPALSLVRQVARSRHMGVGTLLNGQRGLGASTARQLAMYLVHVELGRRQEQISFIFGRTRSTVSYACQRVETLRDDPLLEAEIEAIVRAAQLAEAGHAA